MDNYLIFWYSYKIKRNIQFYMKICKFYYFFLVKGIKFWELGCHSTITGTISGWVLYYFYISATLSSKEYFDLKGL